MGINDGTCLKEAKCMPSFVPVYGEDTVFKSKIGPWICRKESVDKLSRTIYFQHTLAPIGLDCAMKVMGN